MSAPAGYASPSSVEEAVTLLDAAGPDARPMAGGTDLLVQMRAGRRRPELIVDLKRIPELTTLELDAAGLRLGAALSTAALREHPELRELYPGLVEAAALIGSEQVQGRASVGGNLCNASPAADTVPALLVHDARALVAGPEGRREIPVAAFCRGPGETVLGPGEILVALLVPRPPEGAKDAYLRLIPRTEMDIAVVGAAVRVQIEDDRCCEARVALGAVGPTAIRVPEGEEALVGSTLDEDALAAAAAAARAAARPIDDLRAPAAYRTHVAGVLVQRAARIAAARARGDS